ncbi:N4-gp56 family major capsid protein [Cohnella kolymensis]|uniref:N4-gp56 family major capsid protein n=1 Tax=Cohnella kolymensis TaxID=1590652 RepID=UPI001F2621E6|nr:N4-gp56 family major capsid protein [Cohnella kolymensis]
MNLAAKYEKKVDDRFKLKSVTESAVNREYDWTGVDTIKIYSIPTVAMNNYTKTGTSRYGTPAELDNTVQTMLLTRDRSFTFTIDRANTQDTQGVMEAGKALARQIDEVIVPEIDVYRLAAMSAAAITNGHTATAAITASNAYVKLLDAGAALDEDKVPVTGRIAFVTPAYYNFLKQDNTFIKASEIAQNMLINGQVGEVDGVKIVKVPSVYLPASHAFILTHPIATVAAQKLEDTRSMIIHPGSMANS